jgi:hypothetical protein
VTPPNRDPAVLRIGRRASASRLPVVLELPLPTGAIVLATRETWPVAKDLFCVELDGWPDDASEEERVPVASCRRVGASVQLVLDRASRRRSLFVWTQKNGRPLVFWRSERSMRATRPGIRAPGARGLDGPLHVVIDLRERYPWRFRDLPVVTERRRLPAGDYGVFDDDRLVAVVERKKIDEFAGGAVQGSLQLQLAELAALPRALVLIEGRLSQLLKGDARVQPGWLLNLLAALQAAHPSVPLWFAETGPLAANLAYRWLAACANLARAETATPLFDGATPVAGRAASHAASGQRVLAPRAPLTRAGLASDAAPGRTEVRLSATTPERATRWADAMARAAAGEVLTVRAHAARFGLEATTASADLNELARQGSLVPLGRGRGRRFVAPGGHEERGEGPD